jgi:hypothetical protein
VHPKGKRLRWNIQLYFQNINKTYNKRTIDVDEIHFDINKIKKKLKELASLHDKHVNRPTLDDNFDEEKSIDFLTQDITNVNC